MTRKVTIREATAMVPFSESAIRRAVRGDLIKHETEEAGLLTVYLLDVESLFEWAQQPRRLPGPASGSNPRARYVISIPDSPEIERKLVEIVSVLPEAFLLRGSTTLVDTRRKEVP